MNIISQFNQFIANNFNEFLKQYFSSNNYLFKSSDFYNYYGFMNALDNFSTSINKDIIIAYFEYIDNIFFNSSYRKNFCISKGFYERKSFITMFGEITFKRRYYYDKTTKERFFFVDLFFNLPKRKHFDPIVCANIVDSSSEYSYQKSGKLIGSKIGNKIENNYVISRATVRNIVMGFDFEEIKEQRNKQVEKLFIMLDEKFVSSQSNDNKDHMIKSAVVFENRTLEYQPLNENSTKRFRLNNSYSLSSIDDDLVTQLTNYVYNTYDTDYLKDIYFMGDCAKWIKNFPKSLWLKFNKDVSNHFSMDNYHNKQALMRLTTTKHLEFYDALNDLIMNNDKELFKEECLKFMGENKERTTTIINMMEYILNNWDAYQLCLNNPELKCSMESHISHNLADLFTSRPKAFSEKGLRTILRLRMLKINKKDIKKLYYENINHNNKTEKSETKNKFRVMYEIKTNKYDYESETKLPIKYNHLKQIKPI